MSKPRLWSEFKAGMLAKMTPEERAKHEERVQWYKEKYEQEIREWKDPVSGQTVLQRPKEEEDDTTPA